MLIAVMESALHCPLTESEVIQARIMQSCDRFESSEVRKIFWIVAVAMVFFVLVSRAIH
jgi:hypothetical protein